MPGRKLFNSPSDGLGKFVGTCALVLFVIVIFYLVLSGTGLTHEEQGQFGDMFGAVNALFSGFAFAGVIYAILLQRKELALQRQELELTRIELARAADAHEASVTLLNHQVTLAGIAQEETEKEREAQYQPVFCLDGERYENEERRAGLSLVNNGQMVSELEVDSLGGFDVVIKPKISFAGGHKVGVNFSRLPPEEHVFQFRISYQDLLDKRRSRVLEYAPLKDQKLTILPRELAVGKV